MAKARPLLTYDRLITPADRVSLLSRRLGASINRLAPNVDLPPPSPKVMGVLTLRHRKHISASAHVF